MAKLVVSVVTLVCLFFFVDLCKSFKVDEDKKLLLKEVKRMLKRGGEIDENVASKLRELREYFDGDRLKLLGKSEIVEPVSPKLFTSRISEETSATVDNLAYQMACYQGELTPFYLGWAAYYYSHYGCNCGPGGGNVALDATDLCCLQHDLCYYQVEADYSLDIIAILAYPYTTKCKRRKNKTVCKETENDDIGQALCLCDKVFSKCLADAADTYSYWINLGLSVFQDCWE